MLKTEFKGNVFIFQAFDIGDEINLKALEQDTSLLRRPHKLQKYFKNYHVPVAVELPHPHSTSHCISAKIHSFGAVSLCYKISFNSTLEELRSNINDIDEKYQENSVSDVHALFKKIKPYVQQPRFFNQRTSYQIIQIELEDNVSVSELKETCGGTIASLLRFETESLSEDKKNDILASATGYYRGDLIIIDTESAFVADNEYEEIIDLFEFANLQQLELQAFDRILDHKLHAIYEHKISGLSLRSYLPFVASHSPIEELGRLRVDISVIIEKLENSIKLTGETYYAEIYEELVKKLGLRHWHEAINNKLGIITDVRTMYQNKIDSVREDMFSVMIIILIFIELVTAVLSYLKA